MITPEPTPLVGMPNGEKPSDERPFAVIVTTGLRAFAMTSVRSAVCTVWLPVLAAWAGVELAAGAGVAAGTSVATASAVPPDARTALRSETARTVPVPGRPRGARAACTGCVAV